MFHPSQARRPSLLSTAHPGRSLAILTLTLLLAGASSSHAASTAFSYQGRLRDGGTPVTGTYDFEFKLFDAATDGNQVGATLALDDVSVANGLFAVLLDFGASAFPGADRWLETAVRPGAETGAYGVLTPRRLLAAVPYAIQAASATSADNAAAAASLSGTLPAMQLSGTLEDARLSANIPRLDSSPTFTGTVKAGTFSGDGSGLVNLNSLQLTGPLTLGMDPVRVGGYDTAGYAYGVAVAGNYAYVADGGAGMQVVDISNPANPQRVGGCDTPAYATGVAVAGNYAYVANDIAGLQVIDIGNPANPQRVGGYDTAGNAYGVAVAGNYAYVADQTAGLQVIDISNPANPQRVGGCDTAGKAYGVAVVGNYAYVADYSAGLQVIDISDPANPQRVGGYDTAGDARGVAVVGNYAYVADYTAGLQVIDISHPANPQRVGGYDTAGNADGVAVAGNYAYVADHTAGLQVIDISNPANPQRVGGYDTAGNADGVAVAGNYAYVADNAAGLQILAVGTVASMNGIVRASVFAGDGAGLTSVKADQLDGQHGAFYQNAANLNAGTLGDDRLSANVAKLNASQAFTAANTFNSVGNSFTGSGAGLTGVNADQLDGQQGAFYQNAANLNAGTLADARLSANAALLNANQTFSGINTLANPANSFAGDGSGLVNLNLNRSDGSSLTVGQAWGDGPFQVYGSTWVLDQHNDNFGFYFTRGSAWQSFTCATSGTLAAIKAWVYSFEGGPWSATLNLYAGEGTAGALLASQPVAGDGVMQERAFALETPVALTVGNQYTFVFQNASATLRLRGSSDVYAGGRCDYGASYDYHFSTWMENTATVPPLVVQPNTLYVGIGKANPTSALDVNGTVTATTFVGSGAGLTSLDATDLTGTVADARLSANVARLNASQTFTAANTFNNAGNSFTGSGAGLTGVNSDQLDGQDGAHYLNAGNLSAGTLADARLSANVAKLNANQAFTGNSTFTKAVGIGTSTPACALEVDAAGNAQIGIKSTDSSGHLWTLQSTGASSLMSMPPGPGSFQIWDRTAGSSRLMITAAGNVGLSTTPSHALDLAGGAYCDGAQWQNASDRDAKEHFTAIEPAEVLAKVAKLPITEWRYKSERAEVKHLGPVAQDFHAAFGLGDNDKAIGTVDEAGVALAAIQGLNQKVEVQAAQLRAKDAELQSLKASVAELQEAIRRLNPTSK